MKKKEVFDFPMYIKDVRDNWVGEFNEEDFEYCDMDGESSLEVRYAYELAIDGHIVEITREEFYNAANSKMLEEVNESIAEIEDRIEELTTDLEELKEKKETILKQMGSKK